MALPSSTVLSKLNVFVSVLALALYAVGGLVTQWLTATFVLPAMPPQVPAELTLDVHMGLLESCREASMLGQVLSDDCSSGGARDWQKAAAGVAFVGAVSGFACLVLAVLNITVRQVAGRRVVKMVMALLSFLAAVFMGIALILYGVHKKIQVRPPLPLEVDFDIGWAFALSAVSAGFYLILTVLALVDACSKSIDVLV